MKKLLLLLASSFLLAGCAQAQPSTSDKGTESSEPTSSESSSESSSSSSSSSSSGEGGEVTYSVNTSDAAWKSTFSGGTGFVDAGTTDNSGNRARLVTYLDDGHDLISSIATTGAVDSLKYGTLSELTALCLGGGSKSGTLSFTFSHTVTKIRLQCESYWKTYNTYPGDPYDGKSYDLVSCAKLTIGSQDNTLDLSTTQEAGPKTGELALTASGTTAKIDTANDDHGRVMIKSIEFTFLS